MSKIIPVLKIVAKGYIAVKAAVLIFKAVSIATNIVLKAHAIWLKLVSAAETIYIGRLYAADMAMKIFNATMGMSPLGWFAVALGAASAAGLTFAAVFEGNGNYLEKTEEQLRKTASSVVSLEEAMKKSTVQPIQFDKLITADGLTFEDINRKIDTAEAEIEKILKERFGAQQALREENIKNIQNYYKQIEELEKKKLNVYMEQMTSTKTAIDLIKSGDPQAVADLTKNLENAAEIREKTIEEADKAYISKVTDINNVHRNDTTAAQKEIHQKELEKAKEEFENNKKIINDSFNYLKNS